MPFPLSRPASILAFGLGFASCGAGCGKFQERRECTELSRVVNGFIAETKKSVPAEYADPEKAARESKTLAERYRKLSRDLGALGVTSDELLPRVERYKKLAEQGAAALDGAALALEKRDLELARRQRLEFDRAAQGEGPLVREINGACAR